jgi:predicted GNAT superfamily acetyltransferase
MEDVLDEAETSAEKAAITAGVEVREAGNVADTLSVREVLGSIWADSDHYIPRGMIRSLGHFGGVVLGAWEGDLAVGGVVGFYGRLGGEWMMHSQRTGVLESHQSRGVGRALKLAQRAVAIRAGVSVVNWTFDPLIRRNAWFNIQGLGTLGVGYEPNFYGPLDDVFNVGDETDRLVVHWEVRTERARVACGGRLPPLSKENVPHAQARLEKIEGKPHLSDVRSEAQLVALPEDVVRLRREEPGLALDWRKAVREALSEALRGGYRVTAVTIDGYLLLELD